MWLSITGVSKTGPLRTDRRKKRKKREREREKRRRRKIRSKQKKKKKLTALVMRHKKIKTSHLFAKNTFEHS